MLITVASPTLEVTSALREFAQEQASKLEKLNQRISKVRIFLDMEVPSGKRAGNALVKYVVDLPGKTIVMRRAADDMYAGIVDCTDRVIRQVRKLKEKRIDRNR